MQNKNKFFERFWDAILRPEMLVLPGQIAFFLFLSIVPTITVLGYICTYLNISNNLISSIITHAFGHDFSELLTPIITNTQITLSFFITLGVGYFVASNGMSSIIVASNTIYGIKDSGFFRRRLKALVMELVIVILILFILVVPLLGDTIINSLHRFNINSESSNIITNVINIIRGPLSWLIVFIFIKLIYTLAPDKKTPSKCVNGGAIFATIGWIGTTAIYSYYIHNFANYSKFYGSLANITVLMLWVYFLSYILVIGMAMNYHEELERTGVIELQKVIEESANSSQDNSKENKEKTINNKNNNKTKK